MMSPPELCICTGTHGSSPALPGCTSLLPAFLLLSDPFSQSTEPAAQGPLIMQALLTSVQLAIACCSTSSTSGMHHNHPHDNRFCQPMGVLADPLATRLSTIDTLLPS